MILGDFLLLFGRIVFHSVSPPLGSFARFPVVQIMVSVHPCQSAQECFYFRQNKLGYSTGYLALFSVSASAEHPKQNFNLIYWIPRPPPPTPNLSLSFDPKGPLLSMGVEAFFNSSFV